MNNQKQISPCNAARRRMLRGGSSARPVRIAFEPDAGEVVLKLGIDVAKTIAHAPVDRTNTRIEEAEPDCQHRHRKHHQ